ncbi:NADH:flavin oxidoreductase [Amycolatopsis sp. CA-230715]|uniref:NADH:flavin oxidoreductase n=1 Tax=Amycolatopsis sp. CA-230715 TaxID=2745196 RepID=UPI001C021935|nr:NADH:flavin oxidoreductase [Amycolatopsis sp. CA-230715]QWF78942.1 putative N-methylproline demethylase [Amycolatopsis sp. CA-230715]
MRTTDPLLQPFTIRHLTLRNRVVSTSHEPAFADGGLPKDRYRAYHLEKARGGVGLTMIGGSAVVSPDSPPSFGNVRLHDDEVVHWLRLLAGDVHAEGAAVMCQITHLGRRTSNYSGDWLPVLSASPLREPAHRAFPKEAEHWDLDRIARDYAAAAAGCRDGHLDGVEIQSYGHFLDSFLSPATNRRHDEFGGSLENRMAFPRRVIRAVREAVGPDFVVGIRMSLDEDRPGGLTFDEALTAARCFVDDGIDFVSTIRGTIESDATLARVIPSMGTPAAPFLEFTAEVKRRLGIPVMHAARIADVATARHAVREGLLDLVGMTRAQIADPHLVAKIAAGEEDRIRPCVGASYCLDAIYDSGDTKCVHNPATGRELSLPHTISPAAHRIKAVVVGAGPAGLEAARVLGERGHEVVVFEANDVPGGQVRIAASNPRRRDLLGIVGWRVEECKRHGVDIRCGVLAEPEDVLAEAPEVVVIATGGLPNTAFLAKGGDLVADTWDVLTGALRPRGPVLVYDDNGAYPGMDATEVLARQGIEVEYVTPERTLAPDVGSMNSPAYLKVFAEHGVRVTMAHRLRSVRRTGDGSLIATVSSDYADAEFERAVSAVVVEHGTLPNDDLYRALLPGSANLGEVDHHALLGLDPQRVVRHPGGRYRLFRIGDAVTSRNIHAATFDALRLCLPI